MKFRIGVIILSIVMLFLFYKVYDLSTALKENNAELAKTNLALEESIRDVEEARNKYENLEEKAQMDLENCLEAGNSDKWELAYKTNTLLAYSNFLARCSSDEDCHKNEIKANVDKILNADGYVQLIETNGNPLFTKVNIDLQDGAEYVTFKTDKSVRNGAIGIKDCGSSTLRKIGIVLQGKTVKIIDKCEAKGSNSVWAHIQYAN